MPQKSTILSLALLASLPWGLSSSRATAASPEPAATAQPSPEEAAKRKAWNAEMSRRPLPQKGCFNAVYPSTEWHEVPCGAPSKYMNQARGRGGKGVGTNLVGGMAGDFSAQSASLISSAVGSFLSVNGASSVSGDAAGTSTADPNVFMFQINTQFFNNPPACNNVPGCQGWQQFLFSQTQGQAPTGTQQSVVPGTTAIVFMEYWLLNYGTCPTTQPLPGLNWQQNGIDCVFNGPSTYVSPQTVADLKGLVMTASTTATQDKVSLLTTSGTAYAVGADSVLALNNYWNTAEFNVFGDCCSTETNFSDPTTLVIKTSITDGTTNAPTCGTFSFTAEQNNLTMAGSNPSAPTASPVCCPYGEASPAIEFMESNAGHTATCGPTTIEGDPHITTVDGTHYDFQGAGEFVSLRGSDGQEIQTRQTAVSTTFIGTDRYDELTTCVSLNTAVAARVGKHRVTYEPNLSGVPDPSGLQLRIDGVLTSLGSQGVALGSGGRVAPSGGGGLEVDFPDGKTLLVTPEWWQDQSKWYLNVDVSHLGLTGTDVDSGRGIAGALPEGSWLPALPNGASVGPMPAALAERYDVLYEKFANAWRVTDKDSLFDYGPGESTHTFTIKDWPKQNPPCIAPYSKPEEPASEAVAEAACRRVQDENRHSDCVFDVRVTGNPDFAKTYLRTQRIQADSTAISLTDDPNPSLAGEWVAFTAYVAPNSSAAAGFPSGAVQFAVDGSNVGEPVKVDAKGRATLETSRLRVGANRVTASYAPGADSSFLPSTSLEKIHEVKRCFCDAEHDHK